MCRPVGGIGPLATGRLARSVSRASESLPDGVPEPVYVVAVSERQSEKGSRFRALHEGEPFLIPNPWDAGSARLLESLGFEALATSSAALAFSFGRKDGEATLGEVVDHAADVDRATGLPLSVDLENGYGPEPEDAARAIERAAAAGAVGGSIEDYDPAGRIYDLGHATERVAAAAEAARRLDFPFTFTARAENHIRGNPDLDDTIARLRAYEAAGADVLYAPGLAGGEQVRAVREATGLPLNVLAFAGLDLAEILAAGAQRVSVGSGLAWTAYESMAAAAEAMRDRGDLSGLLAPSRVAKLP
jgi:2-methylisocitrate lyase-like PEP mutase family enzyme